MPFKSKAQQRWMFATNPSKAKEWADETKSFKNLPEKKNPQVNPKRKNLPPMREKKASEGLFFEKMARPQAGRFFRDMPGRDDANFHEKSAQAASTPAGGGMNVSPPNDGMLSGQSVGRNVMIQPGSKGGGMYGSGEGVKSKESEKKENDTDRLQDLLANAAGGKERKAEEGEDSEEKSAAATPSDIDVMESDGLPTGFHRPSYEQPEALEAGGERFHSTTAKGPAYTGTGHGLVEGGRMRMGKGSGHQMGKHASAPAAPQRFLGTSYNRGMQKSAAFDENKAEKYMRQGLGSLKRGGSQLAETVEGGVDELTKSPVAMGIGALLLGRAGMKGLGRLAKVGRKPQPSLAGRAFGGLKKLVAGD